VCETSTKTNFYLLQCLLDNFPLTPQFWPVELGMISLAHSSAAHIQLLDIDAGLVDLRLNAELATDLNMYFEMIPQLGGVILEVLLHLSNIVFLH
jgi:hypothetical protein